MWKDPLAKRLAREPGVLAAYLFGSQARGTASDHSDIDVGILLASPPTSLVDAPFALAEELASTLGKRVDLVVMNTAPPDLVHRILRDGELLVDHDRKHRIRFEVLVRNQYFDTQPLRDAYRRAVLSR